MISAWRSVHCFFEALCACIVRFEVLVTPPSRWPHLSIERPQQRGRFAFQARRIPPPPVSVIGETNNGKLLARTEKSILKPLENSLRRLRCFNEHALLGERLDLLKQDDVGFLLMLDNVAKLFAFLGQSVYF